MLESINCREHSKDQSDMILVRRNTAKVKYALLGAHLRRLGAMSGTLVSTVSTARMTIAGSLLAFICWCGLVGCTTVPEHSRADRKIYPEDTPERVSLTPAEVKTAITPANAYYLSPRERKLYANRAAKGDYEAARKLARFYYMHHEGPVRTARDNEKADYWEKVMARLYYADKKRRGQ